jgi:hypothetical protein
MSDWPECEFIINDGAAIGAPPKSPFKTGWENVIFVVEDEVREGSQVTYDEVLRHLHELSMTWS